MRLLFVILVGIIWEQRARAGSSVTINETYLDAPVDDIYWCGPHKNIIFLVTNIGTLYRSDDSGLTFMREDDFLNKQSGSSVKFGAIKTIDFSPHDKNIVTFINGKGGFWISKDCGRSILTVN